MDAEVYGYKKLGIWTQARELVVAIHRMTITELPKFELYEEGAQIRRSIKSVKSNIVEGYGRRRHKAEYLRYLDFAYASALETIDHLETLNDTGSLADAPLFAVLNSKAVQLAKSIFSFTRSVEIHHNESLR
jgi:four helix bundle protein